MRDDGGDGTDRTIVSGESLAPWAMPGLLTAMKRPIFLLAAACLPPLLADELPEPKFEAQSIDDAIKIGYGLAIGDVDGDKKDDIILADKSDIVWYRNPDWKKSVIASHLTLMDNVCIAARDLDGDGKVEIAAGAQWNPGETTDEAKSGAVFYLQRPADPAQPWTSVKLPHEPTVHRMKWVRTGEKQFHLVVVPLHGRGNNAQTGEGAPVKVMSYAFPADPSQAANWTTAIVDETLHKTHNFDVRASHSGAEWLWLGGKEGAQRIEWKSGRWQSEPVRHEGMNEGIGEIRGFGRQILALIQPMHGNKVTFYHEDFQPAVIDETLNQGHALVCATLLGRGFPEVAAGWREPDKDGKVGIRLYVRDDSDGHETWKTHAIDDNKMACEDLVAADLDGDKRLDLIAAGRATHNVVIYWNKTALPAGASKERPELPPLTDEEKARIKKKP